MSAEDHEEAQTGAAGVGALKKPPAQRKKRKTTAPPLPPFAPTMRARRSSRSRRLDQDRAIAWFRFIAERHRVCVNLPGVNRGGGGCSAGGAVPALGTAPWWRMFCH
jgi:hypothetical protein